MTARLDPSLFREDAEPFVRALNAFIAREGHAHPPRKQIEDGVAVGAWVAWRRGEYRRGTLPGARATALGSLPGWGWSSREFDRPLWTAAISALTSFVAREGHARVPQGHREDGHPLGVWVMHRRMEYSRGTLSARKAEVLAAHPGWSWDAGKEVSWPTWFKALREYVQREGHALVPRAHTEGGLLLGKWVHDQRKLHREHRLSSQVEAFLDAVPGWAWDGRRDTWPAYLTAMRSFIRREGHALVPSKHAENGLRLGAWVARGRHGAKLGRLSPERTAELEALPGWVWNVRPSAGRPRRGRAGAVEP